MDRKAALCGRNICLQRSILVIVLLALLNDAYNAEVTDVGKIQNTVSKIVKEPSAREGVRHPKPAADANREPDD